MNEAAQIAEPIDRRAELSATLASLFERHSHAFLAFSGGKESVLLAHACEPWRDRVTLLWVNTGLMLPHMVEFVRAYGARFHLEELPSIDVMQHWRETGIPTAVVPLPNATGQRQPKMQAWTMCCLAVRAFPLWARVQQSPEAALIHGQRWQDVPHVRKLSDEYPNVKNDILGPIWDWSEAEVLAYIEAHGIELPAQYQEGVMDSMECGICPVNMKGTKLAYLDRHYPAVAETARNFIALTIREATRETDRLAAVLRTGDAARTDSPLSSAGAER